MRSAWILPFLIIMLQECCLADTIHVPGDQPTIQSGIDAAVDGDTVLVAPGTYAENIDFKGKDIVVDGLEGPGSTVMDGNSAASVVTFQSGESQDAVLRGFTLMNGNALNGSGINCIASNPRITRNIISGNAAPNGSGGGIYCEGASPIIDHNIISWNYAGYFGGGIECSQSAPVINGNVIAYNSADLSGGGIGNFDSSPVIMNNMIHGNEASSGGGVGCGKSAPTIVNNTITGNAADLGGGIYGHYLCVPVVVNTILWNNDAPVGKEAWVGNSSTITVSFSDVEGGQTFLYIETGSTLNWGPGMIDSDPLFVDQDHDDYHLVFLSPCRASGDNSTLPPDLNEDFEGDPRIAYGMVDMGADEFHTHLYHTGDATPGGSVALKFTDLPGSSPVGFWIAFDSLETPVPGAHGEWYLLPPVLGAFLLPSVPPEGVMILTGPLPSAPPGPYTLYLQAIMGTPLKLTNLCVIQVE